MKKTLLKIIYKTLAFFTRFYIHRTKPYVIGITGSVGKTSCRMIVYEILRKYLQDKKIYTSPKNFNSELGIIFSIFKIEKFTPGILNIFKVSLSIIFRSIFSSKKYDILVLEYGIDHPGDMDFLLSVVKPDISVFTKLDYIHIENFDSKEAIGEEKIKLIHSTKQKAYLNYKDDFLRKKYDDIKLEKDYFNKEKIKFKYLKSSESIESEIYLKDKSIKTNILGEENFLYIDLAFNILSDLGVNITLEQYLHLENQRGRFDVYTGIKNSILIDSSYNAGPQSMKVMIDNTLKIRDDLFSDYDLFFVLGDMRELGRESFTEHKKLSEYVQGKGSVITVGDETKKGFGDNIANFKYSRDAGEYLKKILLNTEKKYIILFKGSQNTIFVEEALKQVLKNKEDKQKLVRQDDYWLNKKNNYFNA